MCIAHTVVYNTYSTIRLTVKRDPETTLLFLRNKIRQYGSRSRKIIVPADLDPKDL